MGVEDFIEAEVGVAVAATAAVLSPRARNVMRRGAVYGLAGALKVGDAVASAARGVASGVRNGDGAQPETEPVAEAASPEPKAPRTRQPRAASGRATARSAEAAS